MGYFDLVRKNLGEEEESSSSVAVAPAPIGSVPQPDVGMAVPEKTDEDPAFVLELWKGLKNAALKQGAKYSAGAARVAEAGGNPAKALWGSWSEDFGWKDKREKTEFEENIVKQIEEAKGAGGVTGEVLGGILFGLPEFVGVSAATPIKLFGVLSKYPRIAAAAKSALTGGIIGTVKENPVEGAKLAGQYAAGDIGGGAVGAAGGGKALQKAGVFSANVATGMAAGQSLPEAAISAGPEALMYKQPLPWSGKGKVEPGVDQKFPVKTVKLQGLDAETGKTFEYTEDAGKAWDDVNSRLDKYNVMLADVEKGMSLPAAMKKHGFEEGEREGLLRAAQEYRKQEFTPQEAHSAALTDAIRSTQETKNSLADQLGIAEKEELADKRKRAATAKTYLKPPTTSYAERIPEGETSGTPMPRLMPPPEPTELDRFNRIGATGAGTTVERIPEGESPSTPMPRLAPPVELTELQRFNRIGAASSATERVPTPDSAPREPAPGIVPPPRPNATEAYLGLKEPSKVLRDQSGAVPLSPIGKAIDFVKQNFTRVGLKGKPTHEAFKGKLGGIEWARVESEKLGQDIKALGKLPETDYVQFMQFMRGLAPIDSLPETSRATAQAARNLVKKYQLQILDALPEGMDRRTKARWEDQVVSSLDSYLRRKYRIFTNPEYEPTRNAVLDYADHIRSRAANILQQRPTSQHARAIMDMDDAQIEAFVLQRVQKIKEGKRFRGEAPNRSATNYQPFMQRKDLSPETRALLGEIEGPEAIQETIIDLAWRAENMKFQTEVARNVGLTDEQHRALGPEKMKDYRQIGGEEFKNRGGMGDLQGMWVPKPVYDFIKGTPQGLPQGMQLLEPVFEAIVDVGRTFKSTKTTLNVPAGTARQALGNIFYSFMADNSIANPSNAKHYRDAFKMLSSKDQMWRNPEFKKVHEWMVRNRFLDTEFAGQDVPWKELEDLFSESGSGKPPRGKRKLEWFYDNPVSNAAGKLYNLPDRVVKVATALKMFRERKSEAEIKKTLDLFPNFSDLPPVTKVLRDFPILGHFVSFKSEALRAGIKYAGMIKDDIARGDAVAASKKTLVLTTMMGMLDSLVQQVIPGNDKLDKEAMEANRKAGQSYRRNSQVFSWPTKEGKVKGFDAGFINPLGDWVQLTRAISKGDTEYLTTLANANVYTDMIHILSGTTANDKPLYHDMDPVMKKVGAITKELATKTFMPPTATQWINFESALKGTGKASKGEAIWAFFGVRTFEQDYKRTQSAAHYKLYSAFKDAEKMTRAEEFKAAENYKIALDNYKKTKDEKILVEARKELAEARKRISNDAEIRRRAIEDAYKSTVKPIRNPIVENGK